MRSHLRPEDPLRGRRDHQIHKSRHGSSAAMSHLRKRMRSESSSRLACQATIAASCSPPSTPPPSSASSAASLSFPNADVFLRLHLEGDPSSPDPNDADADADCRIVSDSANFLDLHVSSAALLRSRYFEALLSDRWSSAATSSATGGRLSLAVPAPSSASRSPFDEYVQVLRLLHTLDFAGAIRSPADALDLLPAALHLVFDAGIDACIRFLESVPWSEEEEARVVGIAQLLPANEAADLLARVSPPPPAAPSSEGEPARTPSEAMLHGLIHSAIHANPAHVFTKSFVAMLLKDYPSRDCVHKVLDEAFVSCLETIKQLMVKYTSPDFRVNVNHEVLQKLSLQQAILNLKHLYWLIERLVDLRVAENAVTLWSNQAALAAELQQVLDDADCMNLTPGLPALVTRCTLRLANSVVTGKTLVPRQVRMQLVKSWLPVLNVSRDIAQPMHYQKSPVYQELEVAFLQIISTLPVPEAQELLQQCLLFSTRNVNDCPHLVAAFKTWFRRAGQPLQGGAN